MKQEIDHKILFLKDLENEKLEEITPFALIGNPVSKSLSHLVHNEVYKTVNFPGKFFRIHLEEDELETAIPLLRKKGFQGLSVTMPFKEKILPFLLNASPIGAVNTLLLQQEGYVGENTDAMAIEKLLSPFFDRRPYASLIGAGGCARAAAYVLRSHSIPFTIYNRSVDKAAFLAKIYGASCDTLENFSSPVDRSHLVINATSVGMEPNVDECPIDVVKLSRHSIVFDTIYRPFRTKLLSAAEDLGLETIAGFDMFAWQAIFQLRFFLSTRLGTFCGSDFCKILTYNQLCCPDIGLNTPSQGGVIDCRSKGCENRSAKCTKSSSIPFEEKCIWSILLECQKTSYSPSFA